MPVSIPHRYGKNAKKHSKNAKNITVSIPHRYGKNGTGAAEHEEETPRFPFLIGTVRTYEGDAQKHDTGSFHSS